MDFTTYAGAMKEHVLKHRNNKFTKVYEVPKLNGCNLYRPREHLFNNNTGKTFAGSDARFLKYRIDDDVIIENANLCCSRGCNFKVEFDEEHFSAKKLDKRVQMYLRHEKRCKLIGNNGNTDNIGGVG